MDKWMIWIVTAAAAAAGQDGEVTYWIWETFDVVLAIKNIRRQRNNKRSRQKYWVASDVTLLGICEMT